MDKPTIKKEMLRNLAVLTNMDGMENNEIILITAAGLIMGKLPGEDSKEILSKLAKSLSEKYFEEYEIKTTLPGNDGYLILEDVTILSGQTRSNMPSAIVFHDQIIGITIGSLN